MKNNGDKTRRFLRDYVVHHNGRYLNRITGVPLDPQEVDLMLRDSGMDRSNIRETVR